MAQCIDRRSFLKVVGGSALALPWLSCAGGSSVGGTVVIVGAGLSGIATAMLLEERGIATILVEARDRVGGRVMTLDDVPGRPDA